MLSWGFGFWMWRLTLACSVLFVLSAEYSAAMCGDWPGTIVTWPWLRLSMIYCCAMRLWSQICVTCRRYWFQDSVDLTCRAGARCLGPEEWLHTYEMVTEHFANPNLSVVVVKCCFLGCVVWDRTFVFNLYRNPDLDDQIFDCLLASMVQPADIRASFLFVGDLNGHHQEWLGSTTTNRHRVTVFDSQLSPVAISWLPAQPMHVVEHLTSWWRMSLTKCRLLL